ncbi:MAG: UDP-N-acetylglucosamine 1-carboxyvinyltransferase, partial [Bdellovibrionales bacterium]|nr:UDP-N-acetylglucosamine 1-carboxyvinyltransferase [Bdellovibrionales bacterium]
MDKLCITGQQKLSGEIKVSKAKNAYLPIIAAVLLNKNKVTLKNIPKLRDISTIFKLLTNLGVKITQENNLTILNAEKITSFEAVYELVKTMRASILVLGPLLTRFKQA